MDSAETTAKIRFAHSQDEFKKLVLTLESGARTLDRIAQRMFIVFKEDDTIETIGRGRYTGSELEAYIEEHRERKKEFFAAVKSGSLTCREVYSRDELLKYAHDPINGDVRISADQARRSFENWKTALREYGSNYQARISNDQLPIKYSIRGEHMVMIHQGVQLRTKGRLKGYLLTDGATAENFAADFKIAWTNAEKDHGKNDAVIRWIDDELIPNL